MADTPIATVRGQPVEREEARREAVKLLATARCPVIAGLGTCAAGAEEAAQLARACGGVLDHSHSDALLRDLGAMREYGWIVATPLLARAQADTVLLVGAGLDGFALPPKPTLDPRTERRVLRLAPEDLLLKLSVLRAVAAGRPVARGADPGGEMAQLARALGAARYGVAVWSAGTMAEIEIEALCGLISDLNAATRWAGLPLAPPSNARGVAETLAWTTGFPTRISFAPGRAEHDPVRFDARRMVESGEADVAVWVQALDTRPPPWGNKVPLIAVIAPGVERLAQPPEVTLTVGKPGEDHDAVLYDAEVGTLVAVRARARTDIPPVSAVLGALATQLREQRAQS